MTRTRKDSENKEVIAGTWKPLGSNVDSHHHGPGARAEQRHKGSRPSQPSYTHKHTHTHPLFSLSATSNSHNIKFKCVPGSLCLEVTERKENSHIFFSYFTILSEKLNLMTTVHCHFFELI